MSPQEIAEIKQIFSVIAFCGGMVLVVAFVCGPVFDWLAALTRKKASSPYEYLPSEMEGMSAGQIAELYEADVIRDVAVSCGAMWQYTYTSGKTSVQWRSLHPAAELLRRALARRRATDTLDASRKETVH